MENISLIIAKSLFAVTVIHVTVLSITIYLHRSMTHRSLVLSRGFVIFFKIWLWLHCGMDSEAQTDWIAVHRLHHAKTDTDEDPHNPQQKGPWKLFFFAIFYYSQSVRAIKKKILPNGETEYEHYTRDIKQDTWLDNLLNVLPPSTGLVIGLCLYWYFLGMFGFWVWLAQSLWMPVVAGGVINVLGHTIGHHIYDSSDTSKSLAPQKSGFFSWMLVAILNWASGGEHLHNQHHFRSNSARMGNGKRLGFDIGYFWIYLIGKCGGIKQIHLADF